jgi:sterol-4alpha-carboxylate 3-dehydrogenase (decarboxylating)
MNVRGTKNVLAACKEFGVQFLVYTSTADVVFSGADQENIDEEEAYCCNPQSAQLRSLVEAEKLVLEATCDTLNTCSIRPAMLYGPGDPLYWPDFLAVAKRLRTVFRPQCKPNLVDWVFVEHAAYAHCLAAEKLLDAHPDVAGHVSGFSFR